MPELLAIINGFISFLDAAPKLLLALTRLMLFVLALYAQWQVDAFERSKQAKHDVVIKRFCTDHLLT